MSEQKREITSHAKLHCFVRAKRTIRALVDANSFALALVDVAVSVFVIGLLRLPLFELIFAQTR